MENLSIEKAIRNMHFQVHKFKTLDEVADYVLYIQGVTYTRVVDGHKPYKCWGACACTGACKTWVKASDLDVLSNISYLVMRPRILNALKQMEEFASLN